MLILEPSSLIARGLRHECYFHPTDETRCIKVVFAGDHKETRREQAYYRLLEKRAISWQMLVRFHGNIETSRGAGAVFDLIRDYNGAVSKTLENYFDSDHASGLDYRNLSRGLTALKQYLLKWKIVTMSLKSHNIVYQKVNETEGTLVVIDNIGNSDFIPVCNYVDRMAVRKIRRKWRRFEDSLAADYAGNQALQQMLGKLSP